MTISPDRMSIETAQALPLAAGRPVRVGLMGEFSAGKTTLINFLLGEDILPTRVTATQFPPVWISYGEPGATAVSPSGEERRIGIDGLADVTLTDTLYIRLTCESEFLQEFDLIDTPGISDPNLSDSYRQAMTAGLDAVIWCTHGPQAWRESERRAFIALPESLRAQSILLATRSDKLDMADRRKVKARLEYEAGHLFREIIMFSTLDAIKACNVEDEHELFVTSGAEALITQLQSIGQELNARGVPADCGHSFPLQFPADLGAEHSIQPADLSDRTGNDQVIIPMQAAGIRPRRVVAASQSGRQRISSDDAARLEEQLRKAVPRFSFVVGDLDAEDPAQPDTSPMAEDTGAMLPFRLENPLPSTDVAAAVSDTPEDQAEATDEDMSRLRRILCSADIVQGGEPGEAAIAADNNQPFTSEAFSDATIVQPDAAPQLTSAADIWQSVLGRCQVDTIADLIVAIGHFASGLDSKDLVRG